MKSGKRMFGVMIVSLLLISSISFVSAGFFRDLFTFGEEGTGEGELADSAVASVDVSGPTSPPEIVFVSDMIDDIGGSFTVSTGGNELWYFSFLTYTQGNPVTYLFPGGSSSIDSNVSDGTTTVDATCLLSTANSYVDGAAYDKSGYTLANYSCNVRMYYFHDSGSWTINAYVTDGGGNSAINSTKTFTIIDYGGFNIGVGYVNWSTIVLGTTSGVPSNTGINVSNTGNMEISPGGYTLDINGSRLNGTETVLTDIIEATKFTVNMYPADACLGGDELVEKTIVKSTVFSLSNDLSTTSTPATQNLTFCLDTLTGIDAQDYSTVEYPWQISVDWS